MDKYKELKRECLKDGQNAVSVEKARCFRSMYRNVKNYAPVRRSAVRMIPVTPELNARYCHE